MQLLFLFIYLFEAVIAFIYYYDNYKIKRKITSAIFILLGLYISAFVLNIIDCNTNYINGAVFFIVNVIFSRLCFNIPLKSSLFHASFLLAIMFLTELITEAGVSYALHIPIDAYRNSISVLIIIGIISKTLYLFVCKFISYLFSYKKHSENDNKKTLVLFLYPAVITVTLSVFLYASTKYNFFRGLNLLCVLVSVLNLIFCCFIFIFNQVVQAQEKELISLQVQSQKAESDKTFYRLLEQKNEEQRILVHDMKHHLYAISSMDDNSEIKSYISKIQPQIEKHQYIGKTKNKMLDLILNKYSMLCRQNEIDFTVNVRASNLFFIDDADLSSLLGNLLDNSFEAAVKCKDPYIRFSVNIEKRFVLLSVVNSSENAPAVNNEVLISAKNNSSCHGYGIKSIERVAEKYNGVCQWDYDELQKAFHFNILFNR